MKTANELVATAKANIEEVDVNHLKQAMSELPIIIDVREPEEFAQGHIFGAVSIPRGLLEFQVEGHPAVAQKLSPELAVRDANIYVYCRTGGRSALAADSLKSMGFKNVKSVAGGIMAWEAAGLPTQ